MALLLAAAEYVLPGWVWRFRDAVTTYRQYNDGAASVLDVLITPEWGRPLAGLTVLALAVLCWRFRRASADSPAFHLILALVLAVTVVIVPKAAPYNQVLLLPGILLLVRGMGNSLAEEPTDASHFHDLRVADFLALVGRKRVDDCLAFLARGGSAKRLGRTTVDDPGYSAYRGRAVGKQLRRVHESTPCSIVRS